MKRYDAVSPVEYQSQGQTKTKWIRCGTAIVNDRGVCTVFLDAFPVNGRLILKEAKPYQGGGGGQGNQGGYNNNQGGGQPQQSFGGGGQGEQTGFGNDNVPF